MFTLRTLGVSCIVGAAVVYRVVAQKKEREMRKRYSRHIPISWKPPKRSEVLECIEKKKYDIVVIGGGSAGAGCALDAASRGYSVLLLEKDDFGSGTSAKSTKLIHGGVRYLEKAIKQVDYRQLALVVEGLKERKSFLTMCPYLTREVGIVLPVKHKIMLPYFWLGTKMYDMLSGMYGIQKSRFLNKQTVSSMFPAIDQKAIAGCMVYYDGQMDDTRVNAMLVETAVYYGADVLNYAEVTEIAKSNGKVTGVVCTDKETNKKYKVASKGVINATGPWSDEIRDKDKPGVKRMMVPSIGAHIVLDLNYTPTYGLINPSTKNGSVLFLLPWHSRSLAGTTDTAASITDKVKATKRDVCYIVEEMTEFISKGIRPKAENIMSAWAGLRPLAMDPAAKGKGTQALVRSHLIETSASGLVTIAGGKWTSFRRMAEDTVTHAAHVFSLPTRQCVTNYIRLIGSHKYTSTLAASIASEFRVEYDIAQHLVSTYGDRARKVCMYAGGKYTRINAKYPYITAEVQYGIEHEHIRRIEDYLGRRSLFAYLDVRRAYDSVSAIASILSSHHNWTKEQLKRHESKAREYLDTMGYTLLMKMEKDEAKLDRLVAKCKSICSTESACNSKKAQALIQKEYGVQEKNAFVSISHARTSVPLSEIVKAIQVHTSTIY